MKNKITSLIIILGAVTTFSGKTTLSSAKKINQEYLKWEQINCRILTTIRVTDENGNVMSTNTISTFSSGLGCIGADKDGIIRKSESLQLEGTALPPRGN